MCDKIFASDCTEGCQSDSANCRQWQSFVKLLYQNFVGMMIFFLIVLEYDNYLSTMKLMSFVTNLIVDIAKAGLNMEQTNPIFPDFYIQLLLCQQCQLTLDDRNACFLWFIGIYDHEAYVQTQCIKIRTEGTGWVFLLSLCIISCSTLPWKTFSA